jgi:hypothetical protein
MISSKIVVAIAGVCLGVLVLPAAVSAGSLGTVDGLPFFGRPYPYGYVYHRPPVECYDIRPVETPFGPRLEETWICDSPVIARY